MGKGLVELFTTSELVSGLLRTGIEEHNISGKEGKLEELPEGMHHFSDLYLHDVMSFLRDIEPVLKPQDSYEVRGIEPPKVGRYLALRKNGILATSEPEIKRLLYGQEIKEKSSSAKR